MKRYFHPFPLLFSLALLTVLYWGLSQADSRAIYAGWDKALHAAVFFVAWWLMRWSLTMSWFWLTLIAVLLGGVEEIHQYFTPGRQADWGDWLADAVGVGIALAIYAVGRLLWLLRESVEDERGDTPLEAHADGQAKAVDAAPGPTNARVAGQHAVDWRWSLKFWRWEYYVVLLAGHERRSLSRREQEIARWSVGFLILVFLVVSTVVGGIMLYLIKLALGM